MSFDPFCNTGHSKINFIGGGGDGYSMLNVLNKEAGIAEDVKIITHVNKTYMRHALQAYFEKSTKEKPIKVDLNEVRIKLIEHPFTDIQTSQWFYSDMLTMYHAGVINGTSETTFEPEGMVTRAQFITMLYRLDGEKKIEDGKNTFTDLAKDAYYTDAVNWGVKNEIIKGMSDKAFAPEANITREQIATILFRYAQYKSAASEARAELTDFADAGSVSDYAKEALRWAAAEKIILGSVENGKNSIRPAATATRAEVAAVLMRFVELLKK